MKRALALAAGLIGALLPFLSTGLNSAAQAALGGADAVGDLVNPVVGCYAVPGAGATACPRDPSAALPGHSQFDITGWSFNAANGHFTASVDVAGAWPKEGDPASVLPGVKELEVRWVFQSGAQNRTIEVGKSCTNKDQTPADGVNIRYNHAQYCQSYVEGPYFADDGYRLFIGLTATVVNGAFHYDWEYGWLEEVSQFFFSLPAEATHDVVSSDKGTLNGFPVYKAPNGRFGGTSFDLTVPYQLMDTLGDDGDPTTPDDLTHTFARGGTSGDVINGVVVATYANVTASVPDPPLCPARNDGYGVLNVNGNGIPAVNAGDIVGGALAPVLRASGPPPTNDPTNCYSQGAGVTSQADWAPGNPYTAGGPNWGGYQPRAFPRALSYVFGTGAAQPGGVGTCAYPAGFADLQPWSAYSTLQPLIDANYQYQYLDGMTVTLGAPGGDRSASVPAVPSSAGGASLRPNLRVANPAFNPTKKCGNISTGVGFYYLAVGGSIIAT